MRRHFGAVFTSARRGPSPNSTIHSVGRSRVDACGRRDQPESRSYKTRECRDESACIRRASRGPRQGRARCADRESDRCAGEDHEYQHLRVGSTHVRRPHRSGARNGPRSRKLGHRRRSRQCSGQSIARGSSVLAVQHRLRLLPKLRGRVDRILPDGAPRSEDGRRCIRFRGDGPVLGRTGGISASAVRRLQLSATARGCPGQGNRLRDAVGHLSHRMALHPPGRHATRRFDGGLRRWPSRFDGRVFGDDPRSEQGDDRRPPPRPATPGRRDRRRPHRRLEGRPRRAGPRANQRERRRQGVRVRRLSGTRPRKATRTPP